MSGDDPTPALAGEILRLGREGRSRREIAAGLGLTLEELALRARRAPELAEALALAEEAARAWWEGLPRAAFAAGTRINLGAWQAAMVSRFGAAALDGASARPRAIYELPDNGTNRRLMPDWWQPKTRKDANHLLELWELCASRAEARVEEARTLLAAFGDEDDDFEDEEDEIHYDQGD
jgi:hypothetical protein